MTEKHGERNVALYMALIIAAYVVIQSFTINANVFPADDIQELAFVNGMTTWTQLLGKDVFGLFRPIKNVLFGILSLFDSSDVSLFRIICVGIGVISRQSRVLSGLCRENCCRRGSGSVRDVVTVRRSTGHSIRRPRCRV